MTKTTTLDIGTIEKPILIFGGCYSNLQATQALQSWAKENNYLPEQCICTGDIVAYCGNPYETVELIQNWGVHCIQGNVEQSLATKAEDCGFGFEDGTVCDILSRGWYPFADNAVTQSQREWLARSNITIRWPPRVATQLSDLLPDEQDLLITNQGPVLLEGGVRHEASGKVDGNRRRQQGLA